MSQTAPDPRHHERLLISSEGLQNLRDLTRVHDFVAALGNPEVQAVIYVREHLDYAVSSFRQRIQNRPEALNFTAFAHRHQDRRGHIERRPIEALAFGNFREPDRDFG